MIDIDMSPVDKSFKDDVIPAFGNNGLPERLVDGVLNRFAVEIAFLGNKS